MMDGKEKIYFLLNRIDDARAIAPSGQPLIIDPVNDLNQNYRDIELKQLFLKLEKDEKILSVLQIPSRIKQIDIVEDLDPYDHIDDGCWHIELLPAFDSYFSKIQQEPEYQEYSGRRSVSYKTNTNINTLLTYEEKYDIVVRAVNEARKTTPTGYHTKLKITKVNRLQELDPDDISSILFKVQEAEVIKMVSTANAKFLTGNDRLPNEPDYYALEILDTFDGWFVRYRMMQKSKPENIDWLNLLKALDVCSDIDNQLQVARTNYVSISSFPYPYIGRFLELFPYDSIGTRKAYQQSRWEGVQYLIKEKAAFEAKYNNEDTFGYGSIGIKVNLVNFDDFYAKIKQEFEKRKQTLEEENKPATHTKVSEKANDVALWSDDFRWEGNDFVFGVYGGINLVSSDRKHIFKVLTDKKGGWATISELKGNKDAGYVRSTIKQIEDRLPEKAKEHIKIVSTQEDDSIEKPNAGAYRIKIQR